MRKNLLIKKDGRTCGCCLEFKSWEEFSKNKRNSTGYQSKCKLCTCANPEKYKTRKEAATEPEKGFSPAAQRFCLGIKAAHCQ